MVLLIRLIYTDGQVQQKGATVPLADSKYYKPLTPSFRTSR